MTATATLTASQIKFCEWLYNDGSNNPHCILFSRSYLRSVAKKNGMAWAPAWIVKDKTRVTSRGLYRVPELALYLEMFKANAQPTLMGTTSTT